MNEEIDSHISNYSNLESGHWSYLSDGSECSGSDSGLQRCVEIPRGFNRMERRLKGLGIDVRYLERGR